MKNYEVVEVLETITAFYPGMFKPEELESVAKAWYSVLKDEDRAKVMTNLKEHVKTNRYRPTIADLLKIPVYEDRGRYIPNAKETRLLLETYENKTISTPEKIKKSLEKMKVVALENVRAERAKANE